VKSPIAYPLTKKELGRFDEFGQPLLVKLSNASLEERLLAVAREPQPNG